MSVARKRLSIHAIRPLMLGAMVIATATSAIAGDWDWLSDPVLRGSETVVQPTRPAYEPGTPTFYRWEGFYLGGQIGRASGNADFSNATRSQISYILANTELETVADWTTLPKGSNNKTSFGGFVGYNLQWGEVITGVELNYSRTGLNMAAQDSIGPILVAGNPQPDGSTVQYRVIVASQAAVAIHDVITARARFAWVAERFLPYAFVGFAVGTADVSRSAVLTISRAVTPPPLDVGGVLVPQPQGPFNPVTLPRNPQSESSSLIAYGYTAGLGIDIAVTPNVFVRGEWEFVQFFGISDIRVNVNSVRTGIGFKF